MSFIKNYTKSDLDGFEIINTFKNGPFNIDDWIKYTKVNSNKIQELFLDKRLILMRYPRFVDIVEEVIQYKTNKETHIYDIKYHVKTLVPKRMPERAKLKPSGEASAGNRNITRIGEEVFIEYLNSEKWRNKPKPVVADRYPVNLADVSSGPPGTNKFKLFRPTTGAIKKISSMESSYKPPSKHINNGLPRSYSVVIKNIPHDIDANEAQEELSILFSDYVYDKRLHKNIQSVCRVNILTNHEKKVKGIAFVDFYHEESYNKVINSTSRFKLGFNVISVEEKKSRD